MVSKHQERAEERAKRSNPKNVTIIEGGIPKVITWKKYKELKLYFPEETTAPGIEPGEEI